MVAEHDLAGPLRDLVAAVMTLGDAVLEIMRRWRGDPPDEAGRPGQHRGCTGPPAPSPARSAVPGNGLMADGHYGV